MNMKSLIGSEIGIIVDKSSKNSDSKTVLVTNNNEEIPVLKRTQGTSTKDSKSKSRKKRKVS